MSGMSTLNSRKSQRHNRQLRQSSLPKMFEIDSGTIISISSYNMNM